jgi:hypothetical protein
MAVLSELGMFLSVIYKHVVPTALCVAGTSPNKRGIADHAFLFVLFQFFEQLLLQMAASGLFDGTPLGRHGFFLRLAFSSRPPFDPMRRMRDFGSLRTNSSLLWFCVGIHEETLALLTRDKKDRNRGNLKNH